MNKIKLFSVVTVLVVVTLLLFSAKKGDIIEREQGAFPVIPPDEKPMDRELSAAMERFYDQWDGASCESSELFTNFKYTPIEGFEYGVGITRRDPSKILKIDGKYYVWYTYRNTEEDPQGRENATATKPAADWDLCDIWYATSDDGFTWEEQGAAVVRPSRGNPGWRSVCTPDILAWEEKYYLYYQCYNHIVFSKNPDGTRMDRYGASVAVADSPNGPWRRLDKIVVPHGELGEWDEGTIADPYPLVHNGKIYLYYKAAFNVEKGEKRKIESAIGVAIADNPLGPFVKSPLNPVINSGHETGLFPFKDGIAALVSLNGPEMGTIQWSPDGLNFEIAVITQLFPIAPGPYIPDAFADNGDARGITWGLNHLNVKGGGGDMSCILARFDCDLSLDYHYPVFKRNNIRMPADVFFSFGLTQKDKADFVKREQAAANTNLGR